MRNSANISAKLRHSVFSRDNFTCKHCGITGFARKRPSRGFAYPTVIDGLYLTIDHVLSRKNGGSNDINNLQTLCHTCNYIKGTK